MKERDKTIIGSAVVLVLFLLVSFFVQTNTDAIRGWIDPGVSGMAIYVLLGIVATVFAPISTLPLIPVATLFWGWFWTGVLSIIAWWLGSVIAFLIARRYGVPIVRKFVSIEKIQYYEDLIPQKHLFWGIVFLRMIIPVDILSYVLGIFSKIDIYRYSLATLIGIMPFAFVIAYVGSLPVMVQFISLLVGVVFFSFVSYAYMKNMKKKKKKKESL